MSHNALRTALDTAAEYRARIAALEAENEKLREAGRRLGNAAMALHDHPDHPEAKPFVRAEYDRMGALLQGQGGADAATV